jgi:hypothetical protein
VVFLCAGASEFTMKTLALYSAVAVVLVLADSTYVLKKEDCEGKNIKHQGFQTLLCSLCKAANFKGSV